MNQLHLSTLNARQLIMILFVHDLARQLFCLQIYYW